MEIIGCVLKAMSLTWRVLNVSCFFLNLSAISFGFSAIISCLSAPKALNFPYFARIN